MYDRDIRSDAVTLLRTGLVVCLVVICAGMLLWNGVTGKAAPPSAPLSLPAGFKAEVYATGLNTPRFVSSAGR